MQTLDLVRNLEQISTKLQSQELVDFLTKTLAAQKNDSITPEDLNTFSSLIFGTQSELRVMLLNKDVKEILENLGILASYSPATLTSMLVAYRNAGSTQNIWANASHLPLFTNLLTSHVALLKSLNLLKASHPQAFERVTNQVLILQIEIRENDPFTMQHLLAVLKSIDSLYHHLSLFMNKPGMNLSITFIDTGSPFAFHFGGDKSILEQLRLLFEFYWNRIRSREYEDFDRIVDAAKKTIEFKALLQKAVAERTLPDYEASRIEAVIFARMNRLIGAGVMLKDKITVETEAERQSFERFRDVKLLGPVKDVDDAGRHEDGHLTTTPAPETDM